jgi:hypothetical protein
MRNNAILIASLALVVMFASRTALAAAGSLDPYFGNGGRVLTNFGHRFDDDRAHDVAVQPGGKIVAVGDHKGALDGTFGGGDGKAKTDVGPGNDAARDLVLKPNGKLVVAGYTAKTTGRFA